MISIIIITILLIFILSTFLIINNQTCPGLLWKVEYVNYPEIKEIYDKFVESCHYPDIPSNYFENTLKNETFQEMRKECMTMDPKLLKSKYTIFETEPMKDSKWAVPIREFYSNKYMINEPTLDVESLFAEKPIDSKDKKCSYNPRIEEYTPRLGCYKKHISKELEDFAIERIKSLMNRLQLKNKFDKFSDSRGSTFMPKGGFMECHSNQLHLAGWRLYMHYITDGDSYFAYRHCYDKSLRIVPDSNTSANLFRIRKLPDDLMFHSIWANNNRWSWGLYIDPTLAQTLKIKSKRL
jgi:hypothetical protein